MGAFFLSPGRGSRSVAGEQVLAQQGFTSPEVLATDDAGLVVFPRQVEDSAAVLRGPDGDFIASVGTLILDGRRDSDALALVRDRVRRGTWDVDDALGSFVLLVSAGRELHIVTDPVGAFPVYLGPGGVVSSSFLAVAAASPRLTLAEHAVYEYVLNGAITGDETLVSEIRRLPWRARYRRHPGGPSVLATTPELPRVDRRPREVQLAEVDARLDDQIRQVGAAFQGVSCGLTSGYDSRLLLALLRRRGITPRTLVYLDGTTDATLAQRVADAEGLELEVIDRISRPLPLPEEMPRLVQENMTAADGWIYHGFFVPVREWEARAERSPRGTVYLHGGGGEIFRNFFMLPDRPLRGRDVIRSFYVKWDRRICSSRFDFDRYVDIMAAKVQRLTGTSAPKLDRQTIEWLYPTFRSRAWTGRENALNAAAGASITPFNEYGLLARSAAIPMAYKSSGTFEADLIRRARPALATIPSQYGHDFVGPPPLRRRARDLAVTHLPVPVRAPLYEVLQRRQARRSRAQLSDAHVRAVLPQGVSRLRPLFDLQHPMVPVVRARVLSVEALAASWGPKLATEWGA